MASPYLSEPDCANHSLAQGTLDDFQDIFADILEDSRFYGSKELMGRRIADLMQARSALLSSAAEARLQTVESEHSGRLQHLKLEMADKECKLVSAKADTDQWKRRAGVLFLKMSSVQEDSDMYSMRCKLLEAEVTRESMRTRSFKSKALNLHQTLAACQQQLVDSQHAGSVLQAQLDAALQHGEELMRQMSAIRAEHEDSQRAAVAHAMSLAKKLADAEAEQKGAEAQAAAAVKAAEVAEKRCEELQWRLQQQDAALAQRAKLAEEARAATEGLSKEGLQAVRDKASFLERELREQLADARRYLEEERVQHRAAESSLACQLAEARADASALRVRLAANEDTQQQHEARQALDVVSSLVQDLAPPDSAARPQKPSNAGDSSSRQAQLQHGRVESEHTGVAPEASIPDAEPKAVPMEVEKPRVRKKRKTAGKAAAAKALVQADEPVSEQAHTQTDNHVRQVEEAPAAVKPRKTAVASGDSSFAATVQPQDVQMDALPANARALRRLRKSAVRTLQVNENADSATGEDVDAQTDTLGDDSSKAAELVKPKRARRNTRAIGQQTQATATAEAADESAAAGDQVVTGEGEPSEAAPTRKDTAPQRPQNFRASSQTNAASEETSAAGREQSGAAAQEAQVAGRCSPSAKASAMHISQVGQQAGAAQQVGRWNKSRPAGVSKVDLTTVWGQAQTPLATSGDKGGAKGGAEGKDKENPAQPAAEAPAMVSVIKPVPGRSRFNTAMEANPLAAVNLRVLEAAGALRPNYVSGLTAPKRPSHGGQAPAAKRKLLPAPKPLGAVGALPQDVLFGQGFRAPKLSRQ